MTKSEAEIINRLLVERSKRLIEMFLPFMEIDAGQIIVCGLCENRYEFELATTGFPVCQSCKDEYLVA